MYLHSHIQYVQIHITHPPQSSPFPLQRLLLIHTQSQILFYGGSILRLVLCLPFSLKKKKDERVEENSRILWI